MLVHQQARMEGIARRLGKGNSGRAMEEREAMIAAGVVSSQTLLPNPDWSPDAPTSIPEWIPDPEEPKPVPIRIRRNLDIADLDASPPLYPMRMLSADHINGLSERIFQHSLGGRQAQDALSRFRRRSEGAAGPLSDRSGEGEVRP